MKIIVMFIIIFTITTDLLAADKTINLIFMKVNVSTFAVYKDQQIEISKGDSKDILLKMPTSDPTAFQAFYGVKYSINMLGTDCGGATFRHGVAGSTVIEQFVASKIYQYIKINEEVK